MHSIARCSSVLSESQVQARDLKHELKDWEAEFESRHGRAATKSDLLERPDIARKYKQYSRLKRDIASAQISEESAGRPIVVSIATSTLSMPQKRKPVSPQPAAAMVSADVVSADVVSADVVSADVGSVRSRDKGRSAALFDLQADCKVHARVAAETVTDAGDDRVSGTPNKRHKRQTHTTATRVHRVYSNKTRHSIAGDLPVENSSDSIRQISEVNSCSDIPAATDTKANDTEAIVGPSGSAEIFDDTDWDIVAYRPPPSLIQRYGWAKEEGQRCSSSNREGGVPSGGAQTMVGSPLIQSLNMMTFSDNEAPASKGISVPMFKARAGRLVKTTSIPLSAFGGQPGGSLQTDSAPTYGEDRAPRSGLDGEMRDLDAGELVSDEDVEADGDTSKEDGQAGHQKKATQKRSTRRVKIKPVGKDGSAQGPARKRAAGGENLVSTNFYKIRLKGGRRGPQSSEERRAALYKRMVAKKGRRKGDAGGPAHKTNGNGDGTGGRHADAACDGYESMCDGGGSGSGGSDGEGDSGGHPASQAPRTVCGRPLSDFGVDGDSEPGETCTLASGGWRVDLRKAMRHVWGFEAFRDRQAEAVRRVVEGRSTLLLLATGAGKSLAYQLPAVLLWAAGEGVTLVVTPLVALMRDQMRGLPAGVGAVCLSGEDATSFGDAAARLAGGSVQLIFVSPERLQSARFQALMARGGVPRVRLAVVDEAHCACEWSHNFRPTYLHLPQALRALGGPPVLAMTATATAALAARLAAMFGVDAGDVVRGGVLRPNIALGAIAVAVDVGAGGARSVAREEALLALLRAPDMAALDAVLVYVATQATADRVAEFLTARSVPAQAYHAGKHAAERTRIQAAFMREPSAAGVPVRVLVATVAFGMGLDKRDIRAVVHFNMPRSMEAYVQEVGRAGRDGAPALGAMLLATDAAGASLDAATMRSWAHADAVDLAAVRRLILRLFPPAFVRAAIEAALAAKRAGAPCGAAEWRAAHTAALELAALQADLDVDMPVVHTLLSYLVLADLAVFACEPSIHRTCSVRFTRTDPGKLAESHAFFSTLTAYLNSAAPLRPRHGARIASVKKPMSSVVVDILELARFADMAPADVTAELHRWRAKRELFLEWQDPSCLVNVTLDTSRFAAAIAVASDVAPADDDAWCDQLATNIESFISSLATSITAQNDAKIRDSLRRVDCISSTMLAAAQLHPNHPNPSPASAPTISQNAFIQATIDTYFAATDEDARQTSTDLMRRCDEAGLSNDTRHLAISKCLDAIACSTDATTATAASASVPALDDDQQLRIRNFVAHHSSQLKTARAIARIFHGLSSPSCSSSQWSWCPEWASMVSTDFDAIRHYAQQELVRLLCAPAPDQHALPNTDSANHLSNL